MLATRGEHPYYHVLVPWRIGSGEQIAPLILEQVPEEFFQSRTR